MYAMHRGHYPNLGFTYYELDNNKMAIKWLKEAYIFRDYLHEKGEVVKELIDYINKCLL